MTTITVKLFGPQARLAQRREVQAACASDTPTAEQVIHAVALACPELAEHLGSSRLAVNHAFVTPTDPVQAHDEVALIGMLGGG
ncbi:MAG: MoaD/ThiS family protein [Phycisphaerales bacterium JB063]